MSKRIATSVAPMFAMIAVGMLALVAFAAPSTQPAGPKGSVTGTALKDGQPLSGITVMLMKPAPAQTGDNAGAGAGNDKQGADKPADPGVGDNQGRGRRGGMRGTEVAHTTTDDKGNFTFSDVPVGEYSVVIRDRATSIGGMSRVTVTENQAATVSITAKERPAHGGNKKGK